MADVSKFQIADGAIINVKDAALRTKFDDNGKLKNTNLPIASQTATGAVKVGNNLTIAEDGTLSALAEPYTLPIASEVVLGGIKAGSDITVDSTGSVTVKRANKADVAETIDRSCLITVQTEDRLINGSANFDLSGPISVVLNSIPDVTQNGKGLMSAPDKIKLDSVENGANFYQLPLATVVQLGGIKSGRPSSVTEGGVTVSSDGFVTVNDYGHRHTIAEVDTLTDKLNQKLDVALKGAANGVAELDSTGKIPFEQIPSYISRLLQGYYFNNRFYKDAAHTVELSANTTYLYIDIPSNDFYRWNGTSYYVVSHNLSLGETDTTAYRGDRGKFAYDHSILADGTNPHATTFANLVDNIATTTRLGGIKVGNNLSITPDGTLSATGSLSIPIATETTLGGIKVGTNLSATSDGVLSATYHKATATEDGLLSKEDYVKLQNQTTIITQLQQDVTNLTNSLNAALQRIGVVETALATKADLVNGRVSKTQLPKVVLNQATGNADFDYETEII